MIRFQPDSWWEAFLRPLAMAWPQGFIYLELIVPDVRFIVAIVLGVVLFALRRRIQTRARAVAILGGFIALTFAPWLITTGNGRYFIPSLLLIGPACIALIHSLPLGPGQRIAAAVALVTLQGAMIADQNVVGGWALTSWTDPPYFDVQVPPDQRPATMVTLSKISYSLVAPLFPHASRWINISAMPSDPRRSINTRRAQDILAASSSIQLVVPTQPDAALADGTPNAPMRERIDHELAPQRLALDHRGTCRLLSSRAMARMSYRDLSVADPKRVPLYGFWLCPLRYPVDTPDLLPKVPEEIESIFARIEAQCPRYFPPGGAATRLLPDGAVRDYATDLKLYVMDDGIVYYKYWRVLNFVPIAPRKAVLAEGFHADCTHIRGRGALPWQRES